jgi:uncharacterized protein
VNSKKTSRAVLAGALLVLAFAVRLPAEAGTAIPPAPQRWLTDTVGFLSPAVAAELDARLEEYQRAHGRQFIVYIGSSTGDLPIEDWSIKTLESWKVGFKGLDDGLALFIMAADRRVRVEVGYGLEDVLPDALAGRVVNEELLPRLQNGDNDGAVRSAVERLMAIVSGDSAAVAGSTGNEREPQKGRPLTLFEKALVGIAVLFFLILFITNPSLALYLLFTILSGGRGGGGGRGGFSGGGGRFGGGGASGSW